MARPNTDEVKMVVREQVTVSVAALRSPRVR